MRLPSRRARSARLALALLSLPLVAAQYSSTSPQELQRRLEQDTNRLVDSLRSQRNSSGRSSSRSLGKSPWELELEARQARREQEIANRNAQSRLDAEWRRDHPNETREQYFARIDKESAAEARELARASAAAEKARIDRFVRQELERRDKEEWNAFRQRRGGYEAFERPPAPEYVSTFTAWCLAHDRATGNQWAAVQAAIFLIDGFGEPADPARAVALVDPTAPRTKKTEGLRPETRALNAYLQITHPDVFKGTGRTPDAATARRELESLAPQNDLAKWYLARVLAESAALPDQKRALELLPDGYLWANYEIAAYLLGNAGPNVRAQLTATAAAILQRHATLVPEAIAQWPLGTLQRITNLFPGGTEPYRSHSAVLFADAVATRFVPAAPDHPFPYGDFNRVLADASAAGSETAHGLALLERFELLDNHPKHATFKPAWTGLADSPLALPAITRWAQRPDALGARSRVALKVLARENLITSAAYTELPEVTGWQAAGREIARLKEILDGPARPADFNAQLAAAAAAEKVARKKLFESVPLDAVPGLLAAIQIRDQWSDERKSIEAFAAGKAMPETSAFAVTSAAFDLAQAAATFDAAFAPGGTDLLRRHRLFEATRLGDAFAPYGLAQELRRETIVPNAYAKLEKLSEARRARDEAAKNSRALAARVIEAHFRNESLDPVLADAVAAGSALAARLQLARRIDAVMPHDNQHPPSWNLPATVVAELDAATAALNARPEPFAEWSLFNVLLSPAQAENTAIWFQPVLAWEKDQQQRAADIALVVAIQPEVDAVLATLALWPGLNQGDPANKTWAIAATTARDQAQASIEKDDGLTALQYFLRAAGNGDRGSLELLARHIRAGDGGLPLSAALADQIYRAAFQMTVADAEVGDAFAADYIGNCYREGSNGIPADPAQALAWLSYAADLGWSPAARTLAQSDADGLNRTPADLLHWAAVRDACEYNEILPKPPRRLVGDRIDLAAVRPQLEAAITALNGFRNQKPAEPTSEEEDAEMARANAAKAELKKNAANGLALMARIASQGNRYVAHDIAGILARGDYGVQPDATLARRFHAAGIGLLERDAEYGDMNAAARLATYALGLGDKPDVPGTLRWFTYSAELGSYSAAETLAQLYTTGAPGLPADAKLAAHWTAFGEKTASDDFKPRAALR